MRFYKITLLILLFCLGLIPYKSQAQQNHSMFFMHYIPESNLLNPAVPISCKWYIGVPVLSSTHFNYGNSSFSYKQLFKSVGNGTYEADIDGAVNRLHWRNYIGTEIHTQLFALGYRKEDYSFMFTITEKNNLSVFYPKKAILLAWRGNSQFEGQSAGLKGTKMNFNHYREYALSFSKHQGDGLYYGVRAKLLFGKLNISTRSMDVDLFTDETTFNLRFQGDLEVKTSMPVIFDTTGNLIEGAEYDESVSAMQLILNRKNPGFAADFGIVYPYNDKIELSASVLDLGFIRWRSHLNTIKGSGDFIYEGPLGDTINTDNYGDELRESFLDSMNVEVSPDKYTTFLPPRILAGGTYKISDALKAGVHGEAIFHPSKVIPSLTGSLHYEPIRNIWLTASYTIQYYTLTNVGLGLVLGRNPVQFYIMSDNVPGLIWPMATRNVNLRFGLNINLGCKIKEEKPAGPGKGKGMLQGRCYWLEQDIQKNYRKQKKKSRR